jgi:ATP-binding cassette subfamily B multidrug efflux pump
MFKLFKMLSPYKLLISFVMLLIFLQSLAQLFLPTLMADIVDIGVVQGDTPYILRLGGLMLVVAAIGTICTIVAGFYSARISMGFSRILRSKLFAHVERFSLQEFDKLGTSSLITRATNDITQVQQVVMMMLRMFLSAPLMVIGGIIMALSKDAKLTLVFAVVIPILAATIFLIAIKGVPLFKALQIKLDQINLVLRENMTGIRVIRAFNRINQERERFRSANQSLTDTAIKANQIMSAMMPAMMLILNLSIIAIMWFGGLRINQGSMQVGDLLAFTQYAAQIMFSLTMLSMMFVMIPRASASAARINEVLEMVPDNRDVAESKTDISRLPKGYVEFNHVTFSYPGAEQPVLLDISFGAKPGEITAIIGGTGSGKSTLMNLLPRFYELDQGSILVNGADIRAMTQENLRARIGFVPQKASLFSGTIEDNIRFGKETATDAEVHQAAEVAQASEFISEMKDGFQSVIAQGGTNLSGGQKQRLSIARALVRKPDIYIFDDSFSALDFKTDAKLRAALHAETADKVVLIVAQRVSTIMDADQIIVLDEGRLAGIGKHQELMLTCKVYREIVASQLSEEESA